ncbi:MAG: hypothetical protein OES25_10990 [Acidobacteriota bacterium]|nr:hypothetical protein [Acidobacteriota bacterium]
MYIRCAGCFSSTWVQSLVPGEAASTVECKSCGLDYNLFNVGELGVEETEQYERAQQFAEFNGIDLPSAYSVLLGVMELDDAKEHRRQIAGAVPDAPAESSDVAEEVTNAIDAAMAVVEEPPTITETPTHSDPKNYDSDFEPAVMNGDLTVEQAKARGSRVALVHRLARRHSLTRELAGDVADNRLSLAEARRRRQSSDELVVPKNEDVAFRMVRNQLMLGVWVIALLALAAYGYKNWRMSVEDSLFENGREARRAAAIAEAEELARKQLDDIELPDDRVHVVTDSFGNVTRVEGPDPLSVLRTFCKSGTNVTRFEPIELVDAIPPSAGRRVGIFRDRHDVTQRFAIRIERGDRSWLAGDGTVPVPITPAPPSPLNAKGIAAY